MKVWRAGLINEIKLSIKIVYSACPKYVFWNSTDFDPDSCNCMLGFQAKTLMNWFKT